MKLNTSSLGCFPFRCQWPSHKTRGVKKRKRISSPALREPPPPAPGLDFPRVIPHTHSHRKPQERRWGDTQQITGRVRLTDGKRKTLAELGKKLGRQALAEVATIVKPETILAWHRTLEQAIVVATAGHHIPRSLSV